jgi:hypothetical protein
MTGSMSVHDFFSAGAVDVKGLGQYLDELPDAARIRAARELDAKEQARLFEAAKGNRPLGLADFVPDDLPTLRQVIHHGRNTLPTFKMFQKRFCRPEAANGTKELWGYNEQAMRWATGPGYFIARVAPEGEVVIDYHDVPKGEPPATWPKILPNSARLSRFVYYQTRDFMRGVSKHVSIGRASRNDAPMDNWFVLCREDRH